MKETKAIISQTIFTVLKLDWNGKSHIYGFNCAITSFSDSVPENPQV